MFYAIRTVQIAREVSETQLLSFYTRKQRDEYVTFEGGESITARQKKGLMIIGVGHTVSGKGGIFFAVPVLLPETQDQKIYADAAAQYGEISHQGQRYALTFQAQLTNRVFDGWFGGVSEGEEYISEWSAPAIGQDGEEYVVRWQFDAIKGEEPKDDGDWPWDEVHEVIPA